MKDEGIDSPMMITFALMSLPRPERARSYMNSANLCVLRNKTACFIRAHFAGHQQRVTATASVYGGQADCKCQKTYTVPHINEGKHANCTVHVCFILHICHTTLQCAPWDQLTNSFDIKLKRSCTCKSFVNQGTLYCKLQRCQIYANVATKLLPSYSRMLALSNGPLSASVLVQYLCWTRLLQVPVWFLFLYGAIVDKTWIIFWFFFVFLAASMTLFSKPAWLTLASALEYFT